MRKQCILSSGELLHAGFTLLFLDTQEVDTFIKQLPHFIVNNEIIPDSEHTLIAVTLADGYLNIFDVQESDIIRDGRCINTYDDNKMRYDRFSSVSPSSPIKFPYCVELGSSIFYNESIARRSEVTSAPTGVMYLSYNTGTVYRMVDNSLRFPLVVETAGSYDILTDGKSVYHRVNNIDKLISNITHIVDKSKYVAYVVEYMASDIPTAFNNLPRSVKRMLLSNPDVVKEQLHQQLEHTLEEIINDAKH